MQVTRVLSSLVLVLIAAANCVAQDTDKQRGTKERNSTEHAIKNTTTRMMKFFANANLTDEQKEEAKTVINKNIGTLIEARQAQNAILTDEQKQNRSDAIAKAKEDGAQSNQLSTIGLKAMALSKEKQAQYDAAGKKVNEATGKTRQAITALLTESQRAMIPKRIGVNGNKQPHEPNKVAEKTRTVSLKLPRMECGGCAAVVRKALDPVDGIANIKTNPVDNTCSFDAPLILDVKAMLDKFAAGGIIQFEGWSFAKGPIL